MEKRVQVLEFITSHSSTKSLVPPLHKFTIENLDLILFPFFGKLNWCNVTVYLLTIFREDGKKLPHWKVGFHFAGFS